MATQAEIATHLDLSELRMRGLTQERAALARAQREKTEIEVARLRGELIPADEVKKAAFNAGRNVRASWEGWCGRVAPTMAANVGVDHRSMRIALEKAVRDHLMELADRPDPCAPEG